MPEERDTRIVEMHFENQQFERNIAKSQKSLEDFKKELDFENTASGLRHFANGIKALDFQAFSNNIQKLTDKFTGLGDAGEFVLSRIRNALESTAMRLEGFIKSFTTAQISVGQDKYDAMNKAAQSLIASGKYTEEQAYAIFDRVQQYTDQTSANFQVMVDKIQEFTSTGRGLKESEAALEGIFNMTAKAGKGATEASNAMGIFSKAMGAGYLSQLNWMSLNQTAHIVTSEFREELIKAGVATGDLIEKQGKYYTNSKKYGKQIEVTAENLETTLHKKWLSKDTMMTLFDKYHFADLSFEAGEAVDVMSKAMETGHLSIQDWAKMTKDSNMVTDDFRKEIIKTAVATGDLVEKQGKYYTNSKKYGKEVEVTAENLEKTLDAKWLSKGTLAAYLEKHNFAETAYKSAQRALTFADAMNAVKESVSSGWMESFQIIFGKVTDAMEFFTNLCERVIASLEGIKEARNAILRSWAAGGGRTAFIETILGDYGKEVETGAYGLLDLFDDVGKMISDGFWSITKIFAGAEGESEHWNDPAFRQAWLGLKLRDITKSLRDFVASVKGFFNEEVKVGDSSKTRLEMIHDIVNGIAAAIAFAMMCVEGVMHFISGLRKQLQPSIDTVTYFFSQLGIMLYGAAEDTQQSKGIIKFFDGLLAAMEPLTTTINSVVVKVVQLMLAFIQWGRESGFFARVGTTIGNVFRKIWTIINRVALPILTFFGDLFDIFTALFKNNFDPKAVAKIGEKVKVAFNKMLKSMVGIESLDKLGEKIREGLANMFNGMLDFLPDSVKNAVKDLFGLWGDSLEGHNDSVFTKIRKFFEGGFGKIFGFLKNLFGQFKNFNLATALKTNFGFGAAYNFLNEIAGWFKGTNLYGVLMAFLGAVTLFSLFKLIKNISGIGKNLKYAIGEIGDSLKSGFKVRYDDYGEYLLKMAQGIAIFVACVAVLGSLDTVSLLKGILALGIIMAMIILFNKLLKKDFKSDSLGDQVGFAAQLIAIGAAISVIVLAISILMLAMIPLSKEPKKMATAVIGFAAIMLVIGAFIALITKSLTSVAKSMNRHGRAGAKEYLELAGLMMALGASIAVMSVGISVLMLAVAPLASMGWDATLHAISVVAGVMLIFGVFIALMLKSLAKTSKKFGSSSILSVAKETALLLVLGETMKELSMAISILILAITPLAMMSWEQLAKALLGLGAIMLMLSAFIRELQHLGSADKGLSLKIAGLAGFAAGLGILVIALLPLAMLKWEAWLRAIIGLGLVMAELFLFIKAIQSMHTGDKTLSVKIAGLAGLALGIGVLMIALLPLAMLKWEAWLRALIGLGLVLAELLLFVKAIQSMGRTDKSLSVKIAGLTSLAIGIGILVLAMIPLSTMSMEGLIKAIAGLAGVMLVLGLFIAAMNKINIKFTKFAGVLLLAGAVAIIALTLMPLGNLSWENWAKVMAGLAAIVAILALFAVGLSFVKVGLGALLAMLGMVLVIVTISLALNEIKNIKKDVMITFIACLAGIMLVMAGVIVILSAVPLLAGIKAIALLGIGIAAICAILALVVPMLLGAVGSGLADFGAKLSLVASLVGEFSDKMNATDDSGINRASVIFEKLKDMMGKLAGFRDYSRDINDFSTALFDLSTGLEIFQNHTSALQDPEGSFAFKMIDKALEYSEKLKNFSAGNFATELYRLGVGLYAFDYAGKEIDATTESKPLQLLQALAGCASDIQILSTVGLDQLKGQLAGLGGAMMLYAQGANEVTGVEGDKTANVEAAVGILQAITTSLVEKGGFVIPDIPKENELAGFGADLAALAGAIVKFVDASSGLGAGTDKAIELLDFIGGDLKSKLTKDNLETAKVFKESGVTPYGLAEFALDIIGLGTALSAFIDSVKNIDDNKTNTAIKALGFFGDLRGQLVAQDAVVSVINFFTNNSISTNQLTQFGKDIEALGLALKAFATSVTWGEKEEGSFSRALEALGFLADLKGRLPELGGLKEIFVGRKQTLTDLGAEIEALGTALADFNGKLVDENGNSKINTTVMDDAIKVLDKIVDFLGKMQTTLAPTGGILQWFTGNPFDATALATSVKNLDVAFAEVAKITNILVDENGQSKIINSAQLTPALEVLTTIVDFMHDLGMAMPNVGGLVNDFMALIDGTPYDLNHLKDDVAKFGETCTELVKLSGILKDDTGKSTVIDAADLDPAIGTLSAIATFVKNLQTYMPSVGGLVNEFSNILWGESYDLTKLQEDIKKFGDTCTELGNIAGVIVDENGEPKVIQASQLQPAIETLTTITGFVQDLAATMPSVGGFINELIDKYAGSDYDLEALRTDIVKFGDACAELDYIRNIILGENGESKLISTETLNDAINTFAPILNFIQNLAFQMPQVGGLINNLHASIYGKKYDLNQLKTDVDNFKEACAELTYIRNIILGENGETKLVDTENLDAAINTFTPILDFVRNLGYQMPEVGGLINDLHASIYGKKYDLNQLKTDVDNFKEACAELTYIRNIILGENGETKLIDTTNLEEAIKTFTPILDFVRNLGYQMPEVGGLINDLHAKIHGKKYNLYDLSVDTLNFSRACGALAGIRDKLLGENGQTKVIDTENLGTAINTFSPILDFVNDLKTKMPLVGGGINNLHAAIHGEEYNLDDLTDDVTKFSNACAALVSVRDVLVGPNGETKVIEASQIQPAIDAFTPITDFATELSKKMPKAGGLIDEALSYFEGKTYDFTKLTTDVDSFAQACGQLTKIRDKLLGENGESKLMETGNVTQAIEILTAITSFASSLSTDMPKIGGYLPALNNAIFGGDYKLSNLEEDVGQMSGVFSALSGLASSLTGEDGKTVVVDDATFSQAVTTLNSVKTFVTKLKEGMPTIGGIANFFGNAWGGAGYSTENLKTDLSNLGTGLANFNNNLGNNFNADKVKPAVEIAKSVADILLAITNVGDGIYDASFYIEGFNAILAALNGSDDTLTKTTGFGDSIVYTMKAISDAVAKYGTIDSESISMFAMMASALRDLASIDPTLNFEGVGASITAGITKGINDGEFVVLEECRSLLSIIAQTLADEMDFNPVITPVLNLDELRGDLATMHELILNGDPTFNMEDVYAMASKYMPVNRTGDDNQNETDYSGFYTRIEQLGTKIDALGSDVAKMKLVLDTGVVAGAVAPLVDEYLGEQNFYNNRGN